MTDKVLKAAKVNKETNRLVPVPNYPLGLKVIGRTTYNIYKGELAAIIGTITDNDLNKIRWEFKITNAVKLTGGWNRAIPSGQVIVDTIEPVSF